MRCVKLERNAMTGDFFLPAWIRFLPYLACSSLTWSLARPAALVPSDLNTASLVSAAICGISSSCESDMVFKDPPFLVRARVSWRARPTAASPSQGGGYPREDNGFQSILGVGNSTPRRHKVRVKVT